METLGVFGVGAVAGMIVTCGAGLFFYGAKKETPESGVPTTWGDFVVMQKRAWTSGYFAGWEDRENGNAKRAMVREVELQQQMDRAREDAVAGSIGRRITD